MPARGGVAVSLVLGGLRTLWQFSGLGVLVAVGVLTVQQTMLPAPPQPAAPLPAIARPQVSLAQIQASLRAYYAQHDMGPSLLVHLACAADDALQARTYDPPPPGVRHVVLRLDQSPDEIERLINGSDTDYPDDAIVAITACFSAKYESGEFP